MAALTMTVGNVLALRQDHAVRLLAWSSVAQAGYILVPFGAVRRHGQHGRVGHDGLPRDLRVREPRRVRRRRGGRHPAPRAAAVGLPRAGRARSPAPGWPLAFALLALAGLPPGRDRAAGQGRRPRRGRGHDHLAGRGDGGQRRDRPGLLRPLAGRAVPPRRRARRVDVRRPERRRRGHRHDLRRRRAVLRAPRPGCSTPSWRCSADPFRPSRPSRRAPGHSRPTITRVPW